MEKKDVFDTNNIAALIGQNKEETAKVVKTNNNITQEQEKNIENTDITRNEEEDLKRKN